MDKLVHWETRDNEAEVQDLDWGEPSVNRRPVSVSLSLSPSHTCGVGGHSQDARQEAHRLPLMGG